MNDRPTAAELLEAVSEFLESDVVPVLDGKIKYNARVAAHVVATVRRELLCEERHLTGEWQRLARLDGRSEPPPEGREAMKDAIRERTEGLVERIRRGDADEGPWRAELLAHLKQTVADKLEVARGQS